MRGWESGTYEMRVSVCYNLLCDMMSSEVGTVHQELFLMHPQAQNAYILNISRDVTLLECISIIFRQVSVSLTPRYLHKSSSVFRSNCSTAYLSISILCYFKLIPTLLQFRVKYSTLTLNSTTRRQSVCDKSSHFTEVKRQEKAR